MKNLHLWIIGTLSIFCVTNDAAAYVKRYCEYTQVANKTPYQTYIAGRAIIAPVTQLTDSDETVDLNTGYGIGIAYGLNLNNIRIEGEMKYVTGAKYTESETEWAGYDYTTTELELSDSHVDLLLNMYYDLKLGDKFAMYIGGGFGFGYNQTTLTVSNADYNYEDEEDYDDYLFAYQIGAGFSYSMTQNLKFDLGYRYGDTSKTDYKATIKSHEITIGARYNF